MIVTLAGHVDHGKSALVHALTGVRTDRLEEEQRRGLTLDLGFAYADLDGQRMGFVDVPGHHRFIHNMVAGVARRQFALLVVAADDGVMPQTREHLDILQTLALERGCIAINKTDLVAPERVEAVRQEVSELCARSFLADAPIFAGTALQPDSLTPLKAHLRAAAAASAGERDSEPFRLAIDRSFTLSGAGCVATGTVHGGHVERGAELVLSTTGEAVRVRDLRVQDESADHAVAGDRAAINLAGIDHQRVTRGAWLVAPEALNTPQSLVIEARLLPDARLKSYGNVHVHLATAHSLARAARLQDNADGTTLIELLLETPLQAKWGDRVVIRDYARAATLGGGPVIYAGAPARRRKTPERLAQLACYRHPEPQAGLEALLALGPVAPADWRASYLLSAEQARDIEAALGTTALTTAPELVTREADLAACTRDVRAAVEQAPNSDPPGLTLTELASALAHPRALIKAAAHGLVQSRTISNARGRYQSSAAASAISPQLKNLLQRCTPLLDTQHPASVGDLSKKLGLPLGPLTKALAELSKLRQLVRINDKRFALRSQITAWADLADALAKTAPFTVKEFRDRSGLGRNMSIDVLEFFDGKGYTRRSGDTRSVVGERERLG
ncbi:MAG: selenocysteine-specific translation elongation factor [Pseudomonadota bacterium]